MAHQIKITRFVAFTICVLSFATSSQAQNPTADGASITLTQSKDETEFTSLFDGKTLAGWVGQDMSFWSVEDGAITGTISPQHKPPMNQYLVWQGGLVEDFELSPVGDINERIG